MPRPLWPNCGMLRVSSRKAIKQRYERQCPSARSAVMNRFHMLQGSRYP